MLGIYPKMYVKKSLKMRLVSGERFRLSIKNTTLHLL